MRRRLLAALAAAAFAAAVYWFVLRDQPIAPRLVASLPIAMIGSGEDALAVAADGRILPWVPPPEEGSLPQLPLSTPPEGLRLQGPVLEQARVLGAAPVAFRPYLHSSYYGTSGVNVELTSGIELHFGDDSQAKRKWRAAAAILADPTVTALDYVNVQAPSRPTSGGSGHTLPPLP